MKIVFIIVNVFVLFQFAQGQVTFQKTYGAGGIDGANCVRQTSDGGYIAAGYGYGLWINRGNYLIKTDQDGDTLWTTIFKGDISGINNGASQIEESSDGGYIICGSESNLTGTLSHITLTKLDANGHTIWSNQYNDSGFDLGNSVCQAYDGGYIIAGTRVDANNFRDLSVIKTDGNGTIIWSKIIGGAGDENASYIIQLPDSGYLVTGTTTSFGTRLKIYLTRLNQNGSMMWFKTYDDDVSLGGCIGSPKVQQINEGGYVIEAYRDSAGVPNTWLLKTNDAGMLLWSKMYSVPLPASMCVASNGGFAIAFSNQVYSWSDYDLGVLKTDLSGNISWCKVYGDSVDEIAKDIRQTSDGGFIVSGSKFHPTNDFDSYLVKTDPNGITDCLVNSIAPHVFIPNVVETLENPFESSGYTSIPLPIIDDNGLIVTTLCFSTGITEADNIIKESIYPNPSHGNIIVEGEFSQFEVINALGEIVYCRQNLYGKSEIDLSTKPSGIYFCRMISKDNSTRVLKLILQ